MQYEEVKVFILQKLQEELPKHLSYHSVAHVKDVLEAATLIARYEKVSEEETILLKTAAVFHDSGFLYGAKEHETRSCEIASAYLPAYAYNSQQVDLICGMIMATRLPQTPKTHLEEILADADLDYLGRDDFFKIGNQLFEELAMFGIITNEDDWNRLQIKFFDSHHYFTETAIKLRQHKKEAHLAIIKSKLEK